MTDSPTKEFHIGDILSAMTGVLVSPNHIGGVYNVLDWMTGESLMTHQLPRVSSECEPFLRETFPDLSAIEIPKLAGAGRAAVMAWLDEQVTLHGSTRYVPKLPPADHTSIDPLTELRMRRPDAVIIGVEMGDKP